MGHKLSPADRALYQAVDEVLHYLWDPIGVAGVPRARDEYQGYAPHVFGLVLEGAEAGTIAAYLSEVATERMGLASASEHDMKVADILLRWREMLLEHAV